MAGFGRLTPAAVRERALVVVLGARPVRLAVSQEDQRVLGHLLGVRLRDGAWRTRPHMR